MTQFQEEKAAQKLGLLRKKEEEESTKLLAQKYQIPYADFLIVPIEIDALTILSEDDARRGLMAIIQSTGKKLTIGVARPDQEPTIQLLKKLEQDGYSYTILLVSRSSLEHAWQSYKKVVEKRGAMSGSIEVEQGRVDELTREITTFHILAEKIEHTLTGRTTEVLEIVIAGGLALDASDVHIEPQEDSVRIRFRLDGVLHDVTNIPTKIYITLLARIKLVSELKLNIKDRAQDGRFTIKTGGVDVEVRVSTLPGPYGENTVLRILNPKAIAVSFVDLGIQPWVTETIETELKKPNGMILTTGPTGSGKTTTLYAFIKKIHTPGIKIITIEDPIEYHLTGVEQTQVEPDKGYDFANGLRAIVRQDPDVILVGEIRDLETAETAMHAALTGHLVFSTLHTNSAAGTIPRLIDLGVKPAIIAPAINIAMAQRLVRKLCQNCRKPFQPTIQEKKGLLEELSQFPKKVPIPPEKEWTLYRAETGTCSFCNGVGYKGRIGLYEIIIIDEVIEQLILKQPSEFEIKKMAISQNNITMRQDGILKVLAGITDVDELERIVGT